MQWRSEREQHAEKQFERVASSTRLPKRNISSRTTIELKANFFERNSRWKICSNILNVRDGMNEVDEDVFKSVFRKSIHGDEVIPGSKMRRRRRKMEKINNQSEKKYFKKIEKGDKKSKKVHENSNSVNAMEKSMKKSKIKENWQLEKLKIGIAEKAYWWGWKVSSLSILGILNTVCHLICAVHSLELALLIVFTFRFHWTNRKYVRLNVTKCK